MHFKRVSMVGQVFLQQMSAIVEVVCSMFTVVAPIPGLLSISAGCRTTQRKEPPPKERLRKRSVVAGWLA
jgi:hypothetical protein